MYVLERMKVKFDTRHGKWFELETLDHQLSTILTTYADAYFYISYPGPGEGYYKGLKLSNIRDLLSNVDQSLTFQQWLDSIGNLTLPFETELMREAARLVKYAQAWHSGYKALPIGRSAHIESNIPDSLKEDLLLTHPIHDMSNFTSKALVSVNGFFHLLDSHPDGVRVMGGGRNIYNSNDNQIGVYSFETIGDIKCYPIQSEWIHNVRVGASLYEGAYMQIPEDINLEGKSLLLVVGGYLNVLNEVYYNVSDRVYRINFSKMFILDRIFQSRKQLALDDIGLFKDPDSPSLTMIDTLKSDSVMLDYLTKSGSFIVLVDSPSFFQEVKPLESLRLPGRSIDFEYDRIPLMGAYGRMLEYHTIREHSLQNEYHSKDQMYVYCSSVNKRSHYDNNTRTWNQNSSINAGRYPYKPFTHEKCYYRFMGVEY